MREGEHTVRVAYGGMQGDAKTRLAGRECHNCLSQSYAHGGRFHARLAAPWPSASPDSHRRTGRASPPRSGSARTVRRATTAPPRQARASLHAKPPSSANSTYWSKKRSIICIAMARQASQPEKGRRKRTWTSGVMTGAAGQLRPHNACCSESRIIMLRASIGWRAHNTFDFRRKDQIRGALAPRRTMVQASPSWTPEKWISRSSPIMTSSISLQWPSFVASGLSNVDAISPPALMRAALARRLHQRMSVGLRFGRCARQRVRRCSVTEQNSPRFNRGVAKCGASCGARPSSGRDRL